MEAGAKIDDELAQRWLSGLRILHIGHGIASERVAVYARFINVTAAILTVVVGTSLFVSATTSDEAWLRYGAAVLSTIAALLGVLQIVFNYPELASKHRQAYVEYGSLRRKLEVLRVRDGRDGGPLAPELEKIGAEWQQVERKSPHLSGRFRKRARRAIGQSGAPSTAAVRPSVGPRI